MTLREQSIKAKYYPTFPEFLEAIDIDLAEEYADTTDKYLFVEKLIVECGFDSTESRIDIVELRISNMLTS